MTIPHPTACSFQNTSFCMMNLPPQAAFFYHGVWTAEADRIILDTVISLKKETGWEDINFPHWFMMTVVDQLKNKLGVTASEEDVCKRVEFLHKRYRVFKNVVGVYGGRWDQVNKQVVASDELWENIMKHNWFAGAYYHNDETEHLKLACIFGMSDVKLEDQKEVIVISDTTEVLVSDENGGDEVVEVNQEVNSPAVFPPTTVRRKLFPEPPLPIDRESTTEPGICFIDLAPNGQLRTRYENGRTLPQPTGTMGVGLGAKAQGTGPSTMSAHASSCGSNNPIGWWSHLAK